MLELRYKVRPEVRATERFKCCGRSRDFQECSVTTPRVDIAVINKALAAALGAAVALALGACSMSSEGAAERVVEGVPNSFQDGSVIPAKGHSASPRAGWVNDEEFGVVLVASSSCPPAVTKTRVISGDEITFSVSSSRSGRGNCTDDAVPRTHVFRVPPEVTERPIKLIPGLPSEIDYILLP